MDVIGQRNEIMQLLQEVSDSTILTHIKQLLVNQKVNNAPTVKEPKFMKYVTTIHKETDVEALFKNYKQPDLSKIVGVLPTDTPLEELIKQLQ